VGQHRRAAPAATSVPLSPRSSIPRQLAVIAVLVTGFVASQLFLPAPQTRFTSGPLRIASAGTVASAAVAAPIPHTTVIPAAKTERAAKTDLPLHSGTGRRVVYSVPLQRVWVVGSAGNVQRTYLVSGRLSQPATGRYHVYSKARWTVSTVSAETMQYMIRFAHGTRTGSPIGFHSIPRDYSGHAAQSVADLGKPLSAGCIRQRMRDAVFLWQFAHVGTSVVVVR
jgi:lipoprotein-anchoring transpeptidase ErfK/SrfK